MVNRTDCQPSVCVQVTPAAKILRFVSRAEQLRLRGQRNYSRYMQLTKGLVDPNGPERLAWRQESAEEELRDAEWNHRHGPIPGGAIRLSILIEPLLRPVVSQMARAGRSDTVSETLSSLT